MLGGGGAARVLRVANQRCQALIVRKRGLAVVALSQGVDGLDLAAGHPVAWDLRYMLELFVIQV